MLLWLFVISALRWGTVQATLEIMIEDVECTEVNSEYIKTCEFEVEDDSTYGASLTSNIETIKHFPETVRVIADIFTVQYGEYSVDMGLHIDTLFCEVMENSNSIANFLLTVVNMNDGECPPGPGVYKQENYVVDNTKGLPSSFPSGYYLMNMTFLNDDTVFVHFNAYVRVM
ncbi:uncharacterized protein LOC108624789 [Ceratina calcarata]|uniref:Uncharacterized protein LOC108624789 n=1 Tax=Ceratina calcarata TaxID=156304 RepID=A0AAJ7IYP5_9HYME|nr:uncharacterized protein LOC108624789 [Ceratina calcarata]